MVLMDDGRAFAQFAQVADDRLGLAADALAPARLRGDMPGDLAVTRVYDQSVFIRKGMEPEQIEEVLGILDFCAAPFGTREYMDYRYGAEGVHHELDGNGAPQLTDLGAGEVNDGYYFISGRPPAITESQFPDFVRWKTDWYNHAAQFSEEDPFAGIRIQRPERFAGAETPLTDKVEDIIRGREDLSTLDRVVADWRRDGGDEGREFYLGVLQEHGRD
jgi:putative aldouronate transport system substrate-binding protein